MSIQKVFYEEGSYCGKTSSQGHFKMYSKEKSLEVGILQKKNLSEDNLRRHYVKEYPSKKKTLPLGRRFLLGKEDSHVRKYSKKSPQKEFSKEGVTLRNRAFKEEYLPKKVF